MKHSSQHERTSGQQKDACGSEFWWTWKYAKEIDLKRNLILKNSLQIDTKSRFNLKLAES